MASTATLQDFTWFVLEGTEKTQENILPSAPCNLMPTLSRRYTGSPGAQVVAHTLAPVPLPAEGKRTTAIKISQNKQSAGQLAAVRSRRKFHSSTNFDSYWAPIHSNLFFSCAKYDDLWCHGAKWSGSWLWLHGCALKQARSCSGGTFTAIVQSRHLKPQPQHATKRVSNIWNSYMKSLSRWNFSRRHTYNKFSSYNIVSFPQPGELVISYRNWSWYTSKNGSRVTGALQSHCPFITEHWTY